jgi:pentatricopeptide repeat protein
LKSQRPDKALDCLQNVLLSSKKPYLQPNITSYNTVLQVLSNAGRVDDVESILHHMLNYCRWGRNRAGTAKIDQLYPNHFSAMAWIAAFARLPQDSLQRSTAGLDAEVAWIQVQEWESQDIFDLTELDENFVWASIVKAWTHAHGQIGHDGRMMDSTPRLLGLWHEAKFATKNVWIPRLAEALLSILDPFSDWCDKIQPLLDDMDSIILCKVTDREPWLELYKRFYLRWLSSGAMESCLNIWCRLDKLDPETAVAALKEVDLSR